MSDYVFFYGGIFSNWCYSPFRYREGVYNCVEQFMMYQKALLFQDYDSALAIRKAGNPRDQKAFGRAVKGFEKDLWDTHARDVVRTGIYQRTCYDKLFRAELVATGKKVLVEAAPRDCIWGIGLAMDHPDREDRTKWRGTNWLGQCLMDVRHMVEFEREPPNLVSETQDDVVRGMHPTGSAEFRVERACCEYLDAL